MLSQLVIVLVASFTATVFSAPRGPVSIQRRNASLTSPSFMTRVRSANGTDVSSSFRTLIYWQSDTISRNSNLTDRQSAARQITTCRSHSARFLGSRCKHSNGFEVSLQEYEVHCQEYPSPRYNLMMGHDPAGALLEPLPTFEGGSCSEHEICVNSMPSWAYGREVATCVETKDFIPDDEYDHSVHQGAEGVPPGSTGKYIGDALREISARSAGIVASGSNGSTPLGLGWLEVDTGAEVGGKVQKQRCKDCFGLRVRETTPNADFMKIEATLMATTITTGLIWVSIFAG